MGEEYLFRGVLQNYLAKVGQKHLSSLGSQLAAGTVLSLLFGLMHGLNPVLKAHAAFDVPWFISAFAFSFIASTLYAFRPKLAAPIGAHFSYNLIAHFF